MTDLEKLCEKYGVTTTSIKTDEPVVHEWGNGATHWKVTLRLGKKRLTTAFHMGAALTGEPKPADVLSSLCSDAMTVENAGGFNNWCDDLGYDSDSRRALDIFKSCEKANAKLRKFLGDKFEEFCNAKH